MKLYFYLEILGDWILYVDIDLVIFMVWLGEWLLFLGDYLGDMIDEIFGKKIVFFVIGGLKNYVYIV